jgi:hypothetical protein
MTEEYTGRERRKENHYDVDLAVLAADVKNIKETVIRVECLIRSDYVTRTEFEPIKRIVYGMVTLILGAVVVAIITLVVRK